MKNNSAFVLLAALAALVMLRPAGARSSGAAPAFFGGQIGRKFQPVAGADRDVLAAGDFDDGAGGQGAGVGALIDSGFDLVKSGAGAVAKLFGIGAAGGGATAAQGFLIGGTAGPGGYLIAPPIVSSGGAVGGVSAGGLAGAGTGAAVGVAAGAAVGALVLGGIANSVKSRRSERKAAAPWLREIAAARRTTIHGVTGFPFTDPKSGVLFLANDESKRNPKIGKARAVAGAYNTSTREFGSLSARNGWISNAVLRSESQARERFRDSDKR